MDWRRKKVEGSTKRTLSRRDFYRGALTGGALLAASSGAKARAKSGDEAEGELLLPPADAKVQTTACAFCIVGCGYKVYTWPVGDAPGGLAADENALGVDFPLKPTEAHYWPSEEMHNVVQIDGRPHHALVVPDPDADVINVGGDYGMGGSLAKILHSEENPTDRLMEPQLRTSEGLRTISWDDAIELIARVSEQVLDDKGPLGWGMKTYSYQFYENTYAITKFALGAVGTPCWAPHDKPSATADVPGLSDAGVGAFSASYQDWKDADVLFVSGVSLYEARPVLFTQWVMGGPKLIVVDPRKSVTAAYAEENGGLHLAVKPGTDCLLHNAIAWVILSEGWEDTEFIRIWCADDSLLQATTASRKINDPTKVGSVAVAGMASANAYRWRRVKYGVGAEGYREFILGDEAHDPANAAKVIGVSEDDIRRAAEMMAKPDGDSRPKTSVMMEKGNYWTHNYPNTASLASVGLLVGAGNRPGRMISRGGGHQRGMVMGGTYPYELSEDTIDDNKVAMNVDHWAMKKELDFCWVIGNTWAGGGTAASASLYKSIRAQTTSDDMPQLDDESALPDGPDGDVDVDYVVKQMKARAEAGGMMLVQQDIYPQALTKLADLVLPAAGWGEAPFARMQGERRLRFYSQIADPPGKAKTDWWIIAQVAKKMGYDGFEWKNANELFEEAGEATRSKSNDYWELVRLARERGQSAHSLLAEYGTTGLQSPIGRNGSELNATRLYEVGFSGPTKRALFVKGNWSEVQERQALLEPGEGEIWIVNRRISGIWSSRVQDSRNPYRLSLWQENYVELHPDDADTFGIKDGDEIVIEARGMVAEGLPGGGESSQSTIEGVARVTDRSLKGTASMHFNNGGEPKMAANNAVSNEPDPINHMYSFKLGRGKIRKA